MGYWYATGYKSADEAYESFLDMCNWGEVYPCELLEITSYKAKSGARRWGIKLRA